MDSPFWTTEAIRHYYEQNTQLFLSFVGVSPTYTIHRSLWRDGVASLDEALHTSHRLIQAEIEQMAADQALGDLTILDLGCGVGGTLFYLLPRLTLPTQALGITLSPLQARVAQMQAHRLSLSTACAFAEADFLAVPAGPGWDLVYSIEAFLHAVAPDRYFGEAARLLRPGGRLILCDDFLTERSSWSVREQAWLHAYQVGWHVPNLRTPAAVEALARQQGLHLRRSDSLTPYLRLRALPDGLAVLLRSLAACLPARHPIVPSMVGSMALQQCLKMGLVDYRFLVFERT